MQLTIDIKDSAVDKIMSLLDGLQSDVTIINKIETNSMSIQPLSKDDEDYQYIVNGREERKHNLLNYGSMNDINWG